VLVGKGTNRYRVDPRSGASSSLGRVFPLTVGDAVEEEKLKTHGDSRAVWKCRKRWIAGGSKSTNFRINCTVMPFGDLGKGRMLLG
jgi:hypothetical protein